VFYSHFFSGTNPIDWFEFPVRMPEKPEFFYITEFDTELTLGDMDEFNREEYGYIAL
jgi:hypothetical protein